MKLTTAKLRQIIKEELNNVLNEGSHEQIYNLMVREMDYGVVGSVRQSPVDYGRYTMNNGVIGIIPPNQSRGNQLVVIPSRRRYVGNNSEESLRQIDNLF